MGKECMDGITKLGFPIGSKEYMSKYVNNIAVSILKSLRALKNNLNNIHILGKLFNTSLLQKFNHTLCADGFSEGINSTNISQFKSEHTTSINSILLELVKHLYTSVYVITHVIKFTSRPTS